MGPSIKYLVSSPYGDVPINTNKLDFPLEGDELKTSYRTYLNSISNFLLRDEFKPLLSSVNKKLGKEISIKEVKKNTGFYTIRPVSR
jgi:hypothetical protein